MKKLYWAIPTAIVAAALVWIGCAKPAEQEPTAPGSTTNKVSSVSQPDSEPRKMENPVDVIKKKLGPTANTRQPQSLKPTPKGTGFYVTSKLSADDLAKAADDHLASLKAVSGVATTFVTFAGGNGRNISNFLISNKRQFRGDYVKLVFGSTPNLAKETLIVNGAKAATMLADETLASTKNVDDYLKESSRAPDQWAVMFPREIYAGIAGGHPIEDLLASGRKAGLEVVSEERYVPGHDRTMILQRRLLLSRKAADVPTKGTFDIEVTIDGTLFLPVTIRTNQEPPGKKPTQLMWTTKWNLASNQKFASDAFNIPTLMAQKGR